MNRFRERLKHIAPPAALFLSTLALLAWALRLRSTIPSQPFHWEGLPSNFLLTHWLGVSFEETLAPLLIIFLLSRAHFFQRIVTCRRARHDMLKLFGAFFLAWLVVLAYTLWRTQTFPEFLLFGFLLLLVGGWLGGWRTGLALGCAALLVGNIITFLMISGEVPISVCFHPSPAPPGANFLECFFLFINFSKENMRVLSLFWLGMAAGLASQILGEARLKLSAMLAAGVGAKLVIMATIFLVAENPSEFSQRFLPEIFTTALAVIVIALVFQGVQSEMAQKQFNQVELSLAQAELRALRSQINPHFFFNSLNAIRYFIRTDAEKARALLLDLSEIFQRTLRAGDFIPLRDELDYVRSYLALEQARLGERLAVQWDLPEEWLAHPVPTLILQPIVENAVVHGVAQNPKGGRVAVTVRRVENDLALIVSDDGPGMGADFLKTIFNPESGDHCIGLRNVAARLRALYGGERISIHSTPGAGTRVELRIPIRDDFPPSNGDSP